jgi:hypothetical protein
MRQGSRAVTQGKSISLPPEFKADDLFLLDLGDHALLKGETVCPEGLQTHREPRVVVRYP